MLRKYIRSWWLILLLIIVWQGLSIMSPRPYLIAPTAIINRFFENWLSGDYRTLFLGPPVFEHLLPSLARLIVGWGIGVVAGMVVGLVLGLTRWIQDYVDPIVEFMRALPPVALVPIFLLLLGIGTRMQVTLIAFTTFFPMLLNTIDGARALHSTYSRISRVFSIKPWRYFCSVLIPGAMPRIFAGLEITSSMALIVMAISEMIASTNGIGYAVILDQQSFRFTDMWVGIVILAVMGYLINALVLRAEKRVLHWEAARR